jgi:uncharacterized protein YqeY
MTKEMQVRADMITAMKNKEQDKKVTLSGLVNALTLAAKEKKSELTPDEENQIVLKMCKQIQETIDSCPENRPEAKAKAEAELAIISAYAPKLMDEAEIKEVILKVLADIGIETPTAKDKGVIMKTLMPLVKGKADGKLVNQVLANMM